MRRVATLAQLRDEGFTRSAIRWGVRTGSWRRVERGVYAEGPADPTALDRAIALVLVTKGAASGSLAALLLGLDASDFRRVDVTVGRSGSGRRPGVRRRVLPPGRVVEVNGIPCTDGLQTLIDLAAEMDDIRWEQALESVLRQRLATIADIERVALRSGAGSERMLGVLALRPRGAPPTDSLLETLMVQLIRTIPGVPPPRRQVEVFSAHGQLVARVDLAWPEVGLFIELDGQHHKNQPVYDASRETAIVAATGWLCGRFTWKEVVQHPVPTARRVGALVEQAQRRPQPVLPLSQPATEKPPLRRVRTSSR